MAAAAAAKSLQSCPTVCDPIDGSPPGSPIPGILQARTLEWVAIAISSGIHGVIAKGITDPVIYLSVNWRPNEKSEGIKFRYREYLLKNLPLNEWDTLEGDFVYICESFPPGNMGIRIL